MIKQIIVAALSALSIALAAPGGDAKVTHSNLEVHIDKYEVAYTKNNDKNVKDYDKIDLFGESHDRFTAEEKEILCRIAEAEATDGTIQQKKNVMSCVMNRVISKDFPDTIESVVFQKGQFSPISDGRYYKVKIQSSTYEAFEEWLQDCDEGNVHDCLFFCMPTCKSAVSGWFSTKEVVFQDGMHNFYK